MPVHVHTSFMQKAVSSLNSCANLPQTFTMALCMQDKQLKDVARCS